MNSMTGYGAGDSTRNGFKVTVELSSVNRRQSEVAVSLPRELEVLEVQIREVIHRSISRGRMTVRIGVTVMEGREEAQVQINRGLAGAYARELKRLLRDLKLDGGVSLDALMRAPGVMQSATPLADPQALWPAIRGSLKKALTALTQMRRSEGELLKRELRKRIRIMRKSMKDVAQRAPRVLKHHRTQLLKRIEQAGLDPGAIDEERLAKEMVLYADRSDISEELTRMESHFAQFDHYAELKEPVGRTLDFLAQEIFREINTIGSKASDIGISQEVVTLKTELEKFREQVQNIE